jgi:hypothetical protein
MYVYSVILRPPADAQGKHPAPDARVMRAFGDSKPREITGDDIDKFLTALGQSFAKLSSPSNLAGLA